MEASLMRKKVKQLKVKSKNRNIIRNVHWKKIEEVNRDSFLPSHINDCFSYFDLTRFLFFYFYCRLPTNNYKLDCKDSKK